MVLKIKKIKEFLYVVEVVFFLAFHMATLGIFFNEHDNYLSRKNKRIKK